MSEAGAYRCPSCGAPADPRAPTCAFCKASLHPRRCPWCFEWFDGAGKDCPRCGAAAVRAPDGRLLHCPSCRERELSVRALGGAFLAGCGACGGVWADPASFKRICDDRAAQSAYLGEGAVLPALPPSDPAAEGVRYRPCASCGELMNRFNFAGCSGVVLDACKPHGVWFDADELRRIVEFIRGGGLDQAREKERRALELERRRLEAARADLRPGDARLLDPSSGAYEPLTSARGLLRLLGL